MGINKQKLFRRIWVGVKVALGIAIGLQDRGRIRVKELDKIKDAIDSVDDAINQQVPPPVDPYNPGSPYQQ